MNSRERLHCDAAAVHPVLHGARFGPVREVAGKRAVFGRAGEWSEVGRGKLTDFLPLSFADWADTPDLATKAAF